jgi:spore coat polysaccharide biosynthesis protein SpsF
VAADHDYALAKRIYAALYAGKPIANERIYAWLAEHPEVSHLNDDVEQKEGDLIAKR